jgi:hypothetical protein
MRGPRFRDLHWRPWLPQRRPPLPSGFACDGIAMVSTKGDEVPSEPLGPQVTARKWHKHPVEFPPRVHAEHRRVTVTRGDSRNGS